MLNMSYSFLTLSLLYVVMIQFSYELVKFIFPTLSISTHQTKSSFGLMLVINNQLFSNTHCTVEKLKLHPGEKNQIKMWIHWYGCIQRVAKGEGKYQTCLCFWFQTIYKSPHMHRTGMLRKNSNHDFPSIFRLHFFIVNGEISSQRDSLTLK